MLRARGGAGYTFGALAILVEAPGRKPSRVRVARSVPVTVTATGIANPPRAVGDVKWLPSRGGEAVGQGPGLAPDGALCWCHWQWWGRASAEAQLLLRSWVAMLGSEWRAGRSGGGWQSQGVGWDRSGGTERSRLPAGGRVTLLAV